MNELLNKSINNPRCENNNPDGIHLLGGEFDWHGKNDFGLPCTTIPFIALNIYDKKVIYGGIRGDQYVTHGDIEYRVLEYLLKRHKIIELDKDFPNLHIIDRLRNIYNDQDLDFNDQEYIYGDGLLNDLEMHMMHYDDVYYKLFQENNNPTDFNINGRVYYIEGIRGCSPVTVFTFWLLGKQGVTEDRLNEIIMKITNDFPKIKDSQMILIANGRGKYIVYGNKINDDELEDNSEELDAHLKDQKAKIRIFKPFRDNKEKLLGKKLSTYDDNGKFKSEMPLAQYHALTRMDENRNNSFKRVFLTESQLRYIIKESNMHELYHNTSFYTLIHMIKENKLFFFSF